MKEIQVKDKTYLFLEIPFDAKNFKFNEDNFTKIIMFETQNNIDSVEIYKEKYQIISTTKDITEEQRLSIIEEHPHSAKYWEFAMMPLYLIYGKKQLIGKYTRFNNGTENDEKSLQSLIQANGLDVNKNYLILQKL